MPAAQGLAECSYKLPHCKPVWIAMSLLPPASFSLPLLPKAGSQSPVNVSHPWLLTSSTWQLHRCFRKAKAIVPPFPALTRWGPSAVTSLPCSALHGLTSLFLLDSDSSWSSYVAFLPASTTGPLFYQQTPFFRLLTCLTLVPSVCVTPWERHPTHPVYIKLSVCVHLVFCFCLLDSPGIGPL